MNGIRQEVSDTLGVECLLKELPEGRIVVVTEDYCGSAEEWDEIFRESLPLGVIGEHLSLEDFEYCEDYQTTINHKNKLIVILITGLSISFIINTVELISALIRL